MVNNMDDFFGNFGAEQPEDRQEDSFFGTFGQQQTTRDRRTPLGEEEPEGEAPAGFTGQFLTGRNYRTVRDYMETNFGMTEDRYSREEIVNSYVTNMRRFNSGQSVVTVSELSKLYQADEDERAKYTDAYRLWDEANGVFSDEADATTGEQIRGVYDYARAAIVDPVNLFSFGFGKLAGIAGGRVAAEGGRRLAAREIAQQAVRTSVREAGQEAAERGVGRTALERSRNVLQAQVTARERTVAGLLNATSPEGALYQQALRRGYRAEVMGGAVFESVASGALDVAYQDAMIQANVQEEFNPLQFTISTFAPAAVAAGILARSTGSTVADRIARQTSVQTAIEKSSLMRVNAAIAAGRAARDRMPSEEAGNLVSKRIQEAASGFRTWREKVEAGEIRLEGDAGASINRIGEDEARAFFYVGSPELGVNGIAQAVVDIFDGETLRAISNGSENFTDAMTNILEYLPRYRQLEVIEFFNSTVGAVTPSLKSDNIQDVTNYLSKISNQWGKTGANLSYAAGVIRNATPNAAKNLKDGAANQSVGKTVVDELLQGAVEANSKEVVEEVKDGLVTRFQNNYVRTLVTHPGTTMLNLMGWASMSTINAVATTLRGTLYGSTGLVHGLVTGQLGSSRYVQKAALEFGSVKRQLQNLVDPYATYDEAMSYLLARPKARKELFKYIAGGVESGMDEDAILRQAGLDTANPGDANFFEKYMQAMQVLYGVRAVDFMSKTQEFMTNLDRQIRRRYGQSYHEFMQREDFAQLMTSKNKDTVKDFLEVETAAVNDTLRATFNKSYAEERGIGVFAKAIEDVRKIPVIGALAPFGQFFNNTMALSADLSGLSTAYHLYLRGNAKLTGKKISPDRDMMEVFSKMVVGYSVMGYFTAQEMQNLEEGLPVFAERQSDGAVVDRSYDFPLSAFKGYGRMIAHYIRDGAVPEDVTGRVRDMVGFASFSRQLTDTYGSVIEGVNEILQDPESDMFDAALHLAGVSAAQYMSGLTRSLDPLNQVVALSRGEDFQALDRSIGNRNINNAIRYVDQFFDPFMDPERQAPVSATSGREPTAQTNRIFGYRELPVASTVERMFADIGRPNWKTELRVPDRNAVRIMNEHIFPILEHEAAQLLESSSWREGTLEERQNAVNRIITGSRSRMMESLRRSYDEPDRKAALIYDIFNSGLRARSRDRLIESYGVDPETLWTLTERQLETLVYTIEREGRLTREVDTRLREGDYRR